VYVIAYGGIVSAHLDELRATFGCTISVMRTTITLDDDVAAAVDQRRREGDKGVSEVVNDLARKGLTVTEPRKAFVQRTHSVGLKVDVSNVAEAISWAEGDDWK